MLRKTTAIALALISLAVGIHFVFGSLYGDAVDAVGVWAVLDWFMAAGILVALIVHFTAKRALGKEGAGDSVTRRYLEVNLAFYATVFLSLWFFWNWFDFLTSGDEPQGTTNLVNWMLIDPLAAVLIGVTSLRLWRDASDE